MSYYRRYRRGARRRKRFRRRRRGYGLKALNNKINALAETVKPEVNFKWINVTDADIYTTHGVDELSDIGQGDTTTTRTGDTVKGISLQLKGLLQQDTDTAAVTNICRVAIVLDRQCNGTAPAWTDVWEAENIYSIREANTHNMGRFKILMDKLYYLSKDADGTTREKKIVKYYRKVNLTIEYNEGATTPRKNGLFLMYLSTAASGAIDFSYHAKLRFTDV